MRVKIVKFIISLSTLLYVANTHADVLPGPALPEQVSKTLSQPRTDFPSQPAPSIINKPQQQATPGGEEAAKIKFQLNGIILKGNRVYSTHQLQALYQQQLNKTISVAELFAIAQDITNFYRNNGYILSRAILPPQHIKDGVVTIQIIEGFINKVEVTGNATRATCAILGLGKQILATPPLQLKNMEKYLLLANDIPGVQVRAVLSPARDKLGAADLSLVGDLKTLNGYFSYDNYGTRYIGPQQLTANLTVNSLGRAGDSTQFTMTKTPKGGELTFLDLNYNLPTTDEGSRLTVGINRAKTHPLFVLQTMQIDGLNNTYYANYAIPIIREREKNLTLQASFSYLDSSVTTFGEQLYTDHLRNLGLGISYNDSGTLYGMNNIYVDIRQGLPFLGYTSDYNPQTALTSRPGGRADYTKFTGQFSRLQFIAGAFSAYAIIRGQYAFSPLLASEQFSFGGSQLGRGYDVAELIGDKGLAGSLELRYDYAFGKIIQGLQFYTFYDAGKIWNYQFISGTPRQQSATSAGVGTRFFFTKYLSGNLMWTQPLTKEVAAEELIGDGKRPRVFFSIMVTM